MSKRAKSKVIRPPGLVVFTGFLLIVAGLWWLFADRAVELGVEEVGASLTGARVDLESADVRPTQGSVSLLGLQVANPDSPMRNLFEAGEITGDLMLAPLLQKKVIVERLVVTGVRFDTERSESGELEDPDPEAGRLWREVNGWVDAVEFPELSLDNLGGVVETDAISADSLSTVRYARGLRDRADSLRAAWETELAGLDPRPRIDSVEAVVRRIEGFRLTPLNATQVPGLLRDGRAALQNLTSLRGEIDQLGDDVRTGMGSLDVSAETIGQLRSADLQYARSLLNVPSLEAPTLSPAIFGDVATDWMKPVLFWAQTAERFLPPGLDPRRRPGPKRARAQGTTVDFREGAEYPAFLLQEGEIGLELTGDGPAAGSYTAILEGLTSAPSLVGTPMRLALGRQGGSGPEGLSLSAVLDHAGATIRDSVAANVAGVALPSVDLGGLGGSVDLGIGTSTFTFARVGDQMDARLLVRSESLTWSGAPTTADPAPGSGDWARAIIWEAITGLPSVEVEVSLSGSLSDPSIDIASNLGGAVAQSLQRELGEQIAEAEARVRAEVDGHVQPVVTSARSRVDGLRTEVVTRVDEHRARVEELRTRLEERISRLPGRE